VLHLLRRDIRKALGFDPESGERVGLQAYWLAAMGMLAGIDLLAKFAKGDDTLNKVGQRFRDFVHTYFMSDINAGDEEILYQLRNALIHSFGLYSEKRHRGEVAKVYRFRLRAEEGQLVEKLPDDYYRLDILTLYELFEKAVSKYQEDLNRDKGLQKNFERMFDK
jgi:hypothetical protein